MPPCDSRVQRRAHRVQAVAGAPTEGVTAGSLEHFENVVVNDSLGVPAGLGAAMERHGDSNEED